jgi:PII-like signaling protein
VSTGLVKLTVCFGERDRADGGYLADALAATLARHAVHVGVVLRGMAGFQRLRSDRLRSLAGGRDRAAGGGIAVDTPENVARRAPIVEGVTRRPCW